MSSTATPHKPVIGIVGGIGSGKSTIARCFGELGCGIIDADDLSHRVMRQAEVVRELTQWWGPEILAPDGAVDRKAVGKIVFNDAAQLARLEDLLHPRIAQLRLAERQRFEQDPAVPAIVEDTPLLMEKGLDRDCDVIVFVEAAEEVRAGRVRESRGWSARELSTRQNRQLPLDTKARRADYVVDNNATQAGCSSQVRRILSQILNEPGLPADKVSVR